MYQASCWSLVHYLLHGDGDKGPRLLWDYIGRARGGVHGVEGMKAALGSQSLEEFEKGWRKYAQGTIGR